jgi:D-alanyl-D-alanine carboxypeptidase
MTSLRTQAALVTVATLAFAASAAPVASADFTPDQTAEIDTIVDGVMADQRIPGVALGVYAPGSSYEAEYGVAEIGSGRPMDGDDSVRIASISKTFTAVATLRLVDKGKLKLRQKVSEFVKGVPNGRKMTIRQLLAMTAGTYDFTRDEIFNTAFSSDPLYPSWKLNDVLEILNRHLPLFPPGEMVSYSDSNYVLLGMIIEAVSGRNARGVIQRLAAKAGLSDTRFPLGTQISAPFAHGYYAGDDGTGPLQDYTAVNPLVPWTAGAMTSNRDDLRRWASALGKGKLISRKLFRKQLRFRTIANPGGPTVGYGLGVFRLDDWIGHNGAIYGFNTVMLYQPAEKATIVIAANKSTNFSTETLDMFFPIANALYPNSVSG